MSRRVDRTHAFRLIYQLEFFDDFDVDERLGVYLRETADADESGDDRLEVIDADFVRKLVAGVVEYKPMIDAAIRKHISGWSFGRLNKAELAVLRLALYELWHGDEYGVTQSIAINEAVNLAKTCSQDGTGSFVNGVLGSVAGSDALILTGDNADIETEDMESSTT